MPRLLHAHFTRTVEYPVTVEVPDDVELVMDDVDGQPKILILEALLGTGPKVKSYLSLQVAARRGLVRVREWET
jgi:hypothetical protein